MLRPGSPGDAGISSPPRLGPGLVLQLASPEVDLKALIPTPRRLSSLAARPRGFADGLAQTPRPVLSAHPRRPGWLRSAVASSAVTACTIGSASSTKPSILSVPRWPSVLGGTLEIPRQQRFRTRGRTFGTCSSNFLGDPLPRESIRPGLPY